VGIRKLNGYTWKQEEERKGREGGCGKLIIPRVSDRISGFTVPSHQTSLGCADILLSDHSLLKAALDVRTSNTKA